MATALGIDIQIYDFLTFEAYGEILECKKGFKLRRARIHREMKN